MQKIVSLICCLFFIFTGFFIVEKIITYIDKKNTDETFMVNTYTQVVAWKRNEFGEANEATRRSAGVQQAQACRILTPGHKF